MNRVVLSALLSHWRTRPFQLLTLVLGLTISTALWSGVQAINAEARASYAAAARSLGGNRLDTLRPIGADSFDQAIYVDLRRAGWPVTPVVEGWLADSRVRLIGLDPVTAPTDYAGAPTLAEDRLVDFLAGRLGYVGETVPPHAALPELATVEGLAPGTVLLDIGAAQRLLGLDEKLTSLRLPPDFDSADRPIETVTGLGWTRIAAADGASQLDALTDSFHLNLTAFGFLSFGVGLFIVYSAIGLAFEQRRPVVRTLRALGVPLGRLMVLMCSELILLALLSGLIGVALGYVIAASLLPDVAATLRGLYGAQITDSLSLSPAWWLGGLVVTLAGASLAAADTLWRTWRMPLLASAQPAAWHMSQVRALRLQGFAATFLLAGALVLTVRAESLASGFLMMGAILIGSALLLPVGISAVLAGLAKRARTPLTQWAFADARQQMSRLSLALIALLLALAANIGVGTMVSSFRDTFTGFLDQRLVSELYVTTDSDDQGARFLRWAGPRSDAVLPIWSVDLTLPGTSEEVELYGVSVHQTYTENWPLIASDDDAWSRLDAGMSALVNEQMARRDGLQPGDTLPLSDARGGSWAVEIVGIYSDYGNPRRQVMVDVEALAAKFPDLERQRYAIRIDPREAEDFALAAQRDLGLSADQIVDQAAIKALSLSIFERTFAVTGALNVLTLGVAGLALLTSMLTIQLMRLPSLAPLWAMGMTRGTLAGTEMAKVLLLALLTSLLAIPVGLAVAWILTDVINVYAFGWRLPLQFYPLDWLRLVALALLAAVLAAALPVIRLANTPPRALLSVFAQER
ncbi:FtsX-like permease family protein [Roseobacter sp. HKCCA0434]|uniref:FtsX-like permease family protein n=1 Tax=Roseobacter sp. HKCCA0434 TaxID=3079297 RepID=UPI002905C49A|nr:FtsX-like permease family protein [Roseobacter sp. HKCCA0434]